VKRKLSISKAGINARTIKYYIQKGDWIMKKTHVMLIAAFFVLGTLLFPTLGFAEFKHAGPPAFTVDIPDDFNKKTPNAEAGEILTGSTAAGVTVTIAFFDIPKDVSLKDACQKAYIPGLVATQSHITADDVEFIGNEEYELDDGTMAYKCEFEWPWTDGSTILTTYVMTADKDGKRVQIATHPWASPDDVVEILESLTFD